MILVRTNHPCLRVGHHSWYQSMTGIIHHVQSYFRKKHLDAYIRTMVGLIGDKLIGIYFLHFTFL
jgi:hypothetical protein